MIFVDPFTELYNLGYLQSKGTTFLNDKDNAVKCLLPFIDTNDYIQVFKSYEDISGMFCFDKKQDHF